MYITRASGTQDLTGEYHFLQMREMLPGTCEGESYGHVVKFNEAENPYSRLGDLEPANLISFAYQIAAGMVRSGMRHLHVCVCVCACVHACVWSRYHAQQYVHCMPSLTVRST